MIDANGNISVAISGTNDPDGKIAKENAERKAKENREKEEKVKEKRAAKKAEEEKAAKKRAEKSAEGKETGDYTLSITGNDVKSMTQSLVAESVSISAPPPTISGSSAEVGSSKSITSMLLLAGRSPLSVLAPPRQRADFAWPGYNGCRASLAPQY